MRNSIAGSAIPLLAGLLACSSTTGVGDAPADTPSRPRAVTVGSLSIAPIFGSHMVLQRGVPVPVFGTADPGATVTVRFGGQTASSVAASDGAWRVNLASMAASTAPATMSVSSGTSTAEFAGVQVGEVWACSGQSNMDMRLDEANGGTTEAQKASSYNLRLFLMKSGNGPSTTTWKVSDPATAATFSAACYWFGLELAKLWNVPIGLVQATHDGTNISEWQTTNGGTGADYLAMVKPIQPYAIKGVNWYQGESNGGDAAYEKKLTDMIAEWRADWGRPDLPFGIVQLPGSGGTGAREGQFNVSVKVPNTFLVVTSDLPGGSQLHPTEKKPIGIRLGLGARGKVYGEPIVYSGPVRNPAGSYRSGSKLVLKFDFAGNGLIRRTGTSLVAFQIADASNRFQTATANIVGPDLVEVFSSRITTPTRVRYGYGTVGNLSNAVSIAVEGGASTVTQLPGSQFDLVVP